MYKIGLIIVICIIWSIWPHFGFRKDLQIIFCDVGQGDATLVQLGTFQLLVDGGPPNDKVIECLGRYVPFVDRTIELVVATHQDSDHIGGLNSVFANYHVRELVWNGEEKQTADFLTFSQAVQREQDSGMRVSIVAHASEINIGSNLVATYLFPRVARFSNATQVSRKCETHLQDITGTNSMTDISSNDGSIVLFVRYKQVTILLMGDQETTGELTLSCLGLLEPMTIVKVGHHGSKSSSSMEFVSRTQPEYAVISVGKNNRFGHPSPEVVSRYDLFRSVLLRTDLMGSIELLSDGDRVWREKSLFDI